MRMYILFLFLLFAESAFSSELTLDQYLDQVRQNNLSLKSASLKVEAMKARVSPSGTWDDPFIAIGKDEIPTDGSMGAVTRIQLSQSVPFPGKSGLKSDIADYKAKSSESDRVALEREMNLYASQVFFKLYYNQRALELNEQLKKLVESSAESAKIRYQSGSSEHHEWLLSRIELNLLEVDRLKLMRENKSLTAVFNELRNGPAVKKAEELKVAFSNEDFLLNQDFQNQPEMKSLDLSLAQSAAELKLARFSYLPDFVFQGMMMKPDPEMMDEKKTWGFMVGINLPLYFWSKQNDLLAAAKLEKQSVEADKLRVENRLRSEEIDAREQLNTARDVVELYQKSVIPSTELAVSNARSGYASRRLPLNQFIETMKVSQTQKLEYIAAQIDVEFARLRLKNLISSPPVLRFAPSRPSLIGAGMGSSAMGSDSVNMGGGMKVPAAKTKDSASGSQSSGGGMGNM